MRFIGINIHIQQIAPISMEDPLEMRFSYYLNCPKVRMALVCRVTWLGSKKWLLPWSSSFNQFLSHSTHSLTHSPIWKICIYLFTYLFCRGNGMVGVVCSSWENPKYGLDQIVNTFAWLKLKVYGGGGWFVACLVYLHTSQVFAYQRNTLDCELTVKWPSFGIPCQRTHNSTDMSWEFNSTLLFIIHTYTYYFPTLRVIKDSPALDDWL